MTRNPRRWFVFVSLLFPLTPLHAEEPALRDLLRDALYTEEVSRDPEKAAKQYEALLARHDEQKPFAATALFRLAEVRRKQDRKDDAIRLYQRLLTEFPNAETETKLAKENLAALGGKLPEAGAPSVDEDVETKEIKRLQDLLKNSPDLVNQSELLHAIKDGKIRVMTWLIQVGKVNLEGSHALAAAAEAGHVQMIEKLMELAGDSLNDQMPEAMDKAIENRFVEVVRTLLKRGADPNAGTREASFNVDILNSRVNVNGGRPLIAALASDDLRIADLLLSVQADVKRPEGNNGVTPLFVAAGNPKAARLIEKLLDMGADVNADVKFDVLDNRDSTTVHHTISPLQYAVRLRAKENAQVLIKHGANLKDPNLFRLLNTSRLDEQDLEVVHFFIDAGASPELPVHDGRTVLAWAVNQENADLVQFLLSKGANPNVPIAPFTDASDPRPNLPQYAGIKGNEAILKLLLEAGGDPRVAPWGENLIRSVSNQGYPAEKALSCIKLLIEKGVVPTEDQRESGFRDISNSTIREYLAQRFPKKAGKAENPPTR